VAGLIWSSRRHSLTRSQATTREARKSETGKATQMPVSPQKEGNITRNGSSIRTCRKRVMNMERPALPIDWKKFPATII